jgi:hypothetical protein
MVSRYLICCQQEEKDCLVKFFRGVLKKIHTKPIKIYWKLYIFGLVKIDFQSNLPVGGLGSEPQEEWKTGDDWGSV